MLLHPVASTSVSPLKSITGWLEELGREFRYRVAPAPRALYADLAARDRSPADPRPVAACDFRSPQIDSTGGRYLYNLIHHVVGAGYLPAYRRNYRFLAGMKQKRYKRLLLDLPLCTYADETRLPTPALLLTDTPEVAAQSDAERVVLIDYADRRADGREIPLRFGMHPEIAAKHLASVEADTDTPRPNTIYFAGNIKPGQYDGDTIRDRYGLLTRIELFNRIIEGDTLPRPFIPRTPEELRRLGDGHPIALHVDHDLRLDYGDWLPAMRRADFFLACPGTRHPMCHNLIEALAVGTIPIVEYDRYTDPPLVDGVSCLAFRGADGAVEAIRRALAMPESERRSLRRGAREFYLHHHAPGSMVETILDAESRSMTLLVNEHRAPRVGEPPATAWEPIVQFAKAPRVAVGLPAGAPRKLAA